MSDQSIKLPILAVKNATLFPNMELPFVFGRAQSLAAIQLALEEDKKVVVIAQKEALSDPNKLSDFYENGCLGVIRKASPKDESVEALIQGRERVRMVSFEEKDGCLFGVFEPDLLPKDRSTEFEALHRTILKQVNEIQSLLTPATVQPVTSILRQIDEPLVQIFVLASMLGMDLENEQKILSCRTRLQAAQVLHEYLNHEKQVLDVQKNIAQKIQSKLSKQQRNQLLKEQLEQIQQELGEPEPAQSDFNILKEKIDNADIPENVQKDVYRELERLARLPAAAADYQITRSYIELVAELPWNITTDDDLNLEHVRQVLDDDHYNLEEVKDRIIEQLVVMKLNPKSKAPILCFVGPPGVGKTSLGESIAKALGRKFERISLGGMHDEAEMRGHRRTYIGAMPGRIIKAIQRAGVKNPVLMLDEIDKLGKDFRGDPSAALMEILDPAQNKSFRDNYLDLPFDLSKVFFITTANQLENLSRPLLDRMEVLQLSGYSDHEKLEIAKQYLVPERVEESGLTKEQIVFSEKAILHIIHRYTREAGLRQLGRKIAQICRKVAVRVDRGENRKIKVGADTVTDFLGVAKFSFGRVRESMPPGVAVGLAWTPTGGDVLFIEATALPGGKEVKLTGQLGEIMKESAQAAQSYLWAHADEYGIDRKKFTESGLHVHVPEGAIPKDGPSAGLTIATALASLYTGVPMRVDTAMTGEMTLSGLILPIGGIKEKALAAHRSGFKRIIIPKENEKDLQEIPQSLLNDIEFVAVETLAEALGYALRSDAVKERRANLLTADSGQQIVNF